MHRTYMHVSNNDQNSQIKADKCKMIVTFDTPLESKILDASDILILFKSIGQLFAKMSIEYLNSNIQHTVYLTGQYYVNAP